jgi:hypothetical protein
MGVPVHDLRECSSGPDLLFERTHVHRECVGVVDSHDRFAMSPPGAE